MTGSTESSTKEKCPDWPDFAVRPTNIDRDAPAVVRIERIIAAAPERLWELQTRIGEWPSWQKDIGAVALTGEVEVGSSFTWTTAGLTEPITSTIYQVGLRRTMLWGGPSAGIMGIHRWTFDAVDGGTRVTTEESWAGAAVDADPAAARKLLGTSLDRWMSFLAAASTSG